MSTNPNVYPMTQVLKNFSFVRSTINVHLKDEGIDKDAWLSLAARVAEIQNEAYQLLQGKKPAPAQPVVPAAAPTTEAKPDGEVVIMNGTVMNKVAARMALKQVDTAAKSATNALKLSKKPETKAKWEAQLTMLRAEYKKALAYLKNPANPEL